jgi:phytoene/squalene synthetase
MKLLFDKASLEVSKITTRTYSTSFSLGIYFLHNSLRDAIYSIYGFVRLADEIVDSFHCYDKEYLLSKFKGETYEAIDSRISLNPILNSFQHAVHQYNISTELIETFLQSMQMDLERVNYNTEKYDQYILGSAEVVGLMCLQVFTENNPALYSELKTVCDEIRSCISESKFFKRHKR